MNNKLGDYLHYLDILLDYRGMAWWLIDFSNSPKQFYCNDQMNHLFSLQQSKLHSIELESPFAGDNLKNIAQINAETAKTVNEEYFKLINGEIKEYANQFPYFNATKEQTLYFSSRAKILKSDENSNCQLIYGILVDVTEKERHKLELRKQKQKFKKLSETDALTKLFNRHYFMKAYQYEFDKAMRAHRSMAVIMIDIDYFKQYNDHYGHLQGDRCLYKVAKCLKRALERKIDIVARYGGEEFIAFVSDISKTQLTSIIDKLQATIRASEIPHESSPSASNLTVSIGAIIGYPEHEKSVSEDFIAAADSNLFKAKSSGRDCSIVGEK